MASRASTLVTVARPPAHNIASAHNARRTGADGLQAPRVGRMLLIALLWGACFVAIQWGLRDASPLWFATLRALLAGVALLLVAVATGRHRLPTRRADWLRLTALALANVTVAFGAMFLATGGTITGVASVLANAQPLLIVLPAWALYGERADAPTLGAMLAGLGGIALLAGGGGSGAALALLAAAGITAGTLLLRQFSALDLVTVSAWSFLIGGAALSGLAAFVEGSPQIAWTPRFITVLLFLGLLGSALAFLLWFEEARRSPLAALSMWALLAPVFGVLFGIGLLGERPSLRETIGLTIVVAAVAAVQARQHRHQPPPSQAATAAARPLHHQGDGHDQDPPDADVRTHGTTVNRTRTQPPTNTVPPRARGTRRWATEQHTDLTPAGRPAGWPESLGRTGEVPATGSGGATAASRSG